MTRSCKFCDLCAADSVVTIAAGTYTTHESRTFDACEEHLEEVKRFDFATREFDKPGDVKL